MYLKRIEIHGFKSFANKIVLEFHDGITGIVGPNGSGKSNVADAVRWVLGEQSAKQLRGAKMEDVIFSGTQTRKPLGYAYVSITMDNSDHKLSIEYDEVTVARRVYRSGESEYLINGNSCRLRDVQELFMDTGIGKEGYSIIGQGQIDRILSSKPEDRRELFDEAAGIVKFKRRKYAAEKNLEEEKQNLYRITDILREIEKQLSPLEKQSGTAKIYLKLKEELKGLEVNQFLKEYERQRSLKEQLEEKIAIASGDLEQANLDYENTKEEYLRLEKQLEEMDASIETEKNTFNDYKLYKEKSEGEIKVFHEQISSITQSEEFNHVRIRSIQAELQIKKAEEEKYQEEKQSIDEKISTIDVNLSLALKELNRIKEATEKYRKEIDQNNNSIFEFLNLNSGIKSNMQRYETMLEQNTLRKAELNQKLLKNKLEDGLYEESLTVMLQNLTQIAGDIAKLQEENLAYDKKLMDSQTIIDQYTLELNEKQQMYLVEKSRLDSLMNLTERYDGYGNSIRKVMEMKTRIPGILGVVADIIKVDKSYETAIETALGGSIQNIVTSDEAVAKQLINYLKQNKYGRATFLPLTNISSNHSLHNDKVLKEEGVIGVAADLVEADSKFNALIDYLLGKIIVVDHIDHATNLARKYHYTLRIVTIEGELLTPGGSISGGAYKNASNLLGRRREIEELEDSISSLSDKVKILTRKKEEEKENNTKLRQYQDHRKTELQDKFLEQNTAKMNIDRERSKKEEAEAVYLEYARELKEIELQAADLQDKLNGLKTSLIENSNKNKEIEESIEQLTQGLNDLREQEGKANEAVSSLRMDLSSMEHNSQFLMENVKRLKKEMDKLYEEEALLKSEIHKTTETLKEKRLSLEETERKLKQYESSIQEYEESIRRKNEHRESTLSIHKNFFTKREELSIKMTELDKECYRLNSQKDKMIEQLDLLTNYMWEEYELTYQSALDYPIDQEISLANVKKSIGEIKAKIKELGDVNVNAIEDYKNLTERFEFLTLQKEDLIKAEEALIQIIEELDAEMRKQFAEKFKAINDQFDVVFKELFGGGKADLELTEDEDILEAGIRINAQPPGKKLQNMMQLSGGEKALTAIALLFAIQNLKPSPFCLLDEIEAALDDSNVKRFAKYLNKLTKDTQFIIITHRRGTMAAADILYGITMQEKGVSTLVSVNLIENDLEK